MMQQLSLISRSLQLSYSTKDDIIENYRLVQTCLRAWNSICSSSSSAPEPEQMIIIAERVARRPLQLYENANLKKLSCQEKVAAIDFELVFYVLFKEKIAWHFWCIACLDSQSETARIACAHYFTTYKSPPILTYFSDSIFTIIFRVMINQESFRDRLHHPDIYIENSCLTAFFPRFALPSLRQSFCCFVYEFNQCIIHAVGLSHLANVASCRLLPTTEEKGPSHHPKKKVLQVAFSN